MKEKELELLQGKFRQKKQLLRKLQKQDKRLKKQAQKKVQKQDERSKKQAQKKVQKQDVRSKNSVKFEKSFSWGSLSWYLDCLYKQSSFLAPKLRST